MPRGCVVQDAWFPDPRSEPERRALALLRRSSYPRTLGQSGTALGPELETLWQLPPHPGDRAEACDVTPDAHSIRELDHMHWGVEMARKGGVSADRVLNAMPLSAIAQYLGQRRHRSLARAA
jgi:hypothetical protein